MQIVLIENDLLKFSPLPDSLTEIIVVLKWASLQFLRSAASVGRCVPTKVMYNGRPSTVFSRDKTAGWPSVAVTLSLYRAALGWGLS